MTQPQDPKKSTRLGQLSFFHICKWITDHMVEITSGKTHTELCQFINEVEELEAHTPAGGLGVHSIPSIIRATGYTPATPGSRSKAVRTKITKAKFQELERKVAKIREEVNAFKESQNRLITIVQEVRGDERDWDVLNEDQISPEDEPKGSGGLMEELLADSKIQDDDTYPESMDSHDEPTETSISSSPNTVSIEELDLLERCQTAVEWGEACDTIKENHGGDYPKNWWEVVKESGMMQKIMDRWDGSAELNLIDLDDSSTSKSETGDLFAHRNQTTNKKSNDDYEPEVSITASPEVQKLLKKYKEEETTEDEDFVHLPED